MHTEKERREIVSIATGTWALFLGLFIGFLSSLALLGLGFIVGYPAFFLGVILGFVFLSAIILIVITVYPERLFEDIERFIESA